MTSDQLLAKLMYRAFIATIIVAILTMAIGGFNWLSAVSVLVCAVGIVKCAEKLADE